MTEVLHRLDPGPGHNPRDVVEGLRLREPVRPGGRPRVAAVMIAGADGRAAVDGRSVALGHPADRALLRELRTAADAILVGTRTLRAERYANLLDDEQRARRVAVGEPAHPLVVTVSRRLELPVEVPLFGEPGRRIVVATESGGRPPAVGAELVVERFAPGTLGFPALLARLAAGHGVRGVACEGGPGLLREAVAQDSVDDVLLTLAPLLVAGDAPTVLEGATLRPPARLRLAEVHRADDHLFLHYRRSA